MKPLLLAGLATLCLLAGHGCASSKPAPWSSSLTGDAVADGKVMTQQGPAKDRVLWQYRTALTALRRGQFDEAKAELDAALASVSGMLGQDKEARKSRRLFASEASKPFLGEPYERVMAYYYRGLLYWRDGEPDNARACFRSAQLQDSDTQDKTYAADYMLLDYLDGVVTAKLGGDGADAFNRAKTFSRLSALSPCDTRANVLFFLEYGAAPLKYGGGQFGEELRFREGRAAARSAVIKINRQTLAAHPCDDLYYQATTRGGRVMDHVLGHKAVFKSATDGVGDAALISGAILASHQGTRSSMDEVGVGLLAAGVVSKIFSAATKATADTRTWDNLPQFLSFGAVELPPGPHTATIEFRDAAGAVLGGQTKTITFTVLAPPRDTVLFVSDQSSTPQNL